MKRLFTCAFIFIGGLSLLLGCTKNGAIPVPNNTMSAQIGTIQFNSTGNDVKVWTAANLLDTLKTAFFISATMDVGSNVLSYVQIVILDYDNTNPVGTYSVSSSEAIGVYNAGLSGEDFFIDGSVVITESGSIISGTFHGTTQSGIIISNGTFSVEF